MEVRTIPARVHGRALFELRDGGNVLVGFHGYGEIAEWHMEQLRAIPGSERWSLVAVQALHPFYKRSGDVVASWMTRLDRELAIGDNLAYVRSVLDELPSRRALVFAGFSQGAAMAARAAVHAGPCDGAILLGGELPPEILQDDGARLPPVLLGRGSRDEWYTEEKFRKDLSFLEPRTVVTRCVFAGGHEWTDEFRSAAGAFLSRIERR